MPLICDQLTKGIISFKMRTVNRLGYGDNMCNSGMGSYAKYGLNLLENI